MATKNTHHRAPLYHPIRSRSDRGHTIWRGGYKDPQGGNDWICSPSLVQQQHRMTYTQKLGSLISWSMLYIKKRERDPPLLCCVMLSLVPQFSILFFCPHILLRILFSTFVCFFLFSALSLCRVDIYKVNVCVVVVDVSTIHTSPPPSRVNRKDETLYGRAVTYI